MKEYFAVKAYGAEAIWEKLLEKRKINGGCWEWTGGRFASGYGRICLLRTTIRVHRLSFQCLAGDLKEGMVLDHVCRNKICFNPQHLRQVTAAQNCTENSESFAAKNKAKKECKNGHPLDFKNTYVQKGKGFRYCRKCALQRSRKYKKKVSALHLVPCVVCGEQRVDRAHIRTKGATGNNETWNLICLCRSHHDEQHRIGWKRFCEKYEKARALLRELGWEIIEAHGKFWLRNEKENEK